MAVNVAAKRDKARNSLQCLRSHVLPPFCVFTCFSHPNISPIKACPFFHGLFGNPNRDIYHVNVGDVIEPITTKEKYWVNRRHVTSRMSVLT